MKLRPAKVVSKGKTSKWPFDPPRTHPIMSRGTLAAAHLEDVAAKAKLAAKEKEKEAVAFVTSEADAKRIAQEQLNNSKHRGWKDKFKKKGGA